MRSAPLGTPRTASRIRGSSCRRRAGARLLLAGDNAFEDGLEIIHYCRLGDLLRVVCDEWMYLYFFSSEDHRRRIHHLLRRVRRGDDGGGSFVLSFLFGCFFVWMYLEVFEQSRSKVRHLRKPGQN